jgi:hypothetical protein
MLDVAIPKFTKVVIIIIYSIVGIILIEVCDSKWIEYKNKYIRISIIIFTILWNLPLIATGILLMFKGLLITPLAIIFSVLSNIKVLLDIIIIIIGNLINFIERTISI